jgi:hypothetical protein
MYTIFNPFIQFKKRESPNLYYTKAWKLSSGLSLLQGWARRELFVCTKATFQNSNYPCLKIFWSLPAAKLPGERSCTNNFECDIPCLTFLFSLQLMKASFQRCRKTKMPPCRWHSKLIRGPEGSRTPNLLIRSQMLYPIKLRVRSFFITRLQM